MEICRIDTRNIDVVAALMSKIKPDFWDFEGALSQLKEGIGWFVQGEGNKPIGWVLCKDYTMYKTLEIECLGFDNNGEYLIGKQLEPLIDIAESWAKEKRYANMRFIIGSRGLSCHGCYIKEVWSSLLSLREIERPEFGWFLKMGYKPFGILPNIYGDNYHGIILIKNIC